MKYQIRLVRTMLAMPKLYSKDRILKELDKLRRMKLNKIKRE